MKQETLNKKLIERLEWYGLKKDHHNSWTYKLFSKEIFNVHILNCIVCMETEGECFIDRIAVRYECRSIKDLDYLLTYSMRSPFYYKILDNYKQALKLLNK